MTRVVAILAHPDDAEILAKLPAPAARRQRRDLYVSYTPDSVRGQEGRGCPAPQGQILRAWASPIWEVSRYTPEDVERLTAFLLARPPDLVLTHWLEDTHPDHVASVRLVIEALLHYAVSHGLEDVDASRRAFPQVWSCDTYGGLGSRGAFAPEWYIDISAVWEQKIHALAAHQPDSGALDGSHPAP